MNQIISAVLVVSVTGLLFGCLLAFASVIFAVKKDERTEQIAEALPGANCGGCGYAGCAAYAEAIVEKGAAVNLCSVGKAPVAEKIGEIMGCSVGETIEKTAMVMCSGVCGAATEKYRYKGVNDCGAASRLAGGAKVCLNGCLGLGSCVSVCDFGAISVCDGVAAVDPDKCASCGKCVEACPKGLIKLVQKNAAVHALCANTDKGAAVNKYCAAGCIGCKICEKNCPSGAVKVIDNHAVIDYEKCISCGVCAEKCPKKVIHIS